MESHTIPRPGVYEIRIKGHLDDRWAEWFSPLRLTREDDGNSVLQGTLQDQAHLHGTLERIRDVGMAVLSVRNLDPPSPRTNRALVQERYGAPTEVLAHIDRPLAEPAPGEVRVRVHAASIAGDDWHLVRGQPYLARLATGIRAPRRKTLGQDFAGVVDAVGEEVSRFTVGEEVFGWAEGTLADFITLPEADLLPRPKNISVQEAAALPVSGLTALQALRDTARVRPGHRVLITGASGGVGSLAIQVAAALGAEVTGVCGPQNVQLVRQLGAHHVIDYTLPNQSASAPYDALIDLAGAHSLRDARRLVRPGGTLALVGNASRRRDSAGGLSGLDRWFMGTNRWLMGMAITPFVRQRIRPVIHKKNRDDLIYLASLVESGRLRPVVGQVCSLGEAPHFIDAPRQPGKTIVQLAA